MHGDLSPLPIGLREDEGEAGEHRAERSVFRLSCQRGVPLHDSGAADHTALGVDRRERSALGIGEIGLGERPQRRFPFHREQLEWRESDNLLMPETRICCSIASADRPYHLLESRLQVIDVRHGVLS